MTIVALPAGFCPNAFSMRLSTVQRAHASPFGGSEQVVDMLNDRWMASLSLPARTHADAARVEAFVAAMRGMTNTVNLHHFARPVPRGTMRGTPTVAASFGMGAEYIVLAAVPGETLLAGDLISVDGMLLMNATDTGAGGDTYMGVSLANRLRRAVTTGMPAIWDRPTAPFRMVSAPGVQYIPGYAESVSFDFVEAVS